MKHLIPILLLFTFSPFQPFTLSAAEVVVYSPASDQQLHVQSSNPTNDIAATFPSSYTGHRAVCNLPGVSTNDTFTAWIGGDTYTPGDPYGVSTCREYPAIELTRTSPIPRIKIGQGHVTAFPERTVFDATNGIWESRLIAKNIINFVDLPESGNVHIRVVRWRINNYPWYIFMGLEPTVVLDKIVDMNAINTITENDFLSSSTFDIDWDNLINVTTNREVFRTYKLSITNMEYLVVVGDGKYYFNNTSDSNKVNALNFVINRRYGTNHVQAVALPSGAQPLTHPVFRFRADCPEQEGYTACQIQVMSGATTNWTSGTIRIPPRDNTGTYVYTAPDLTDLVSTNGTYSWRVRVYNSRYKGEFTYYPEHRHTPIPLKWSDPIPVTFK